MPEPSIADIAQQLSDEAMPEGKIKLILHVLGFREFAPDLSNVLELAAELFPIFESLSVELPKFRPVIDLFLEARQLCSRAQSNIAARPDLLGSPETSPKPRGHAKRRRFENLSGHVGKLLTDYDLARSARTESAAQCNLLAVLWLLAEIPVSVGQTPSQEEWLSSESTRTNYGAIFSLGLAGEEDSDSHDSSRANSPQQLGIFVWLRRLDEQYYRGERYGMTAASPFGEIIARLGAVSDDSIGLKLSVPSDSANEKSEPQARSYVEFTERYLSTNHWYYPTPSELKRLKGLSALIGASTREPDISAMVLLVALATCRTVEEALCMDVSFASDAPMVPGLQFQGGSGHRGMSWKLNWVIPNIRFVEHPLVLRVPQSLDYDLRDLARKNSSARLVDLLPVSIIDWKTRVENRGIELLKCDRARLNHILRDAVLRAAYAHSSNRALVAILASHRIQPKEMNRAEQFALAHYMDPLGNRSSEIYEEACRELIGSFGPSATKGPNPGLSRGYRLHLRSHTAIAEKYRAEVQLRDNSIENLVTCHNSYARYTLLMLLAATGHRRSRTPVYFPWDLRLDEELLFIADKIIVGSEARFVPLASAAIEQVKHYFAHLVVLRCYVPR